MEQFGGDRADSIFREAASQAIDLTTLPILRHVLIRIANDNYRLGVLPARRCLRSQIFLTSSWYVSEVRQRKILSTSDGVEDALSRPSVRSCDRSYARRSLASAVFRAAVRPGGNSD